MTMTRPASRACVAFFSTTLYFDVTAIVKKFDETVSTIDRFRLFNIFCRCEKLFKCAQVDFLNLKISASERFVVGVDDDATKSRSH